MNQGLRQQPTLTSDHEVFHDIADRYDRLCDYFSLGAHRIWKRALARTITRNHPSGVILDLATGTGNIPELINRQNPNLYVRGIDICRDMTAQAKRKFPGRNRVFIEHMDAYNLQKLPTDSMEAVTIAFAMKLCNRKKVLAQAMRVLKPGGVFYCLETSQVPKPLQGLHSFYLYSIIPLVADLLKESPVVYRKLISSIRAFPDQESLRREFHRAGFKSVSHRNLSFGIVSIHQGIKP